MKFSTALTLNVAGIFSLCAATTLLGICIGGCKAAETAIIGGVDQACEIATSQPEAEWVYFTCAILDAAGNQISTQLVKVPAGPSAQTFAMKYPPKNPTTVTVIDGGK
jgi:hypothetical protein